MIEENDVSSAQGQTLTLLLVSIVSLLLGGLSGMALRTLFHLTNLNTFLAVFSIAFALLIVYYIGAAILGLMKKIFLQE